MNDAVSTANPAALSAVDAVKHARVAFDQGITRPIAWRIAQLRAMATMLRQHEQAFAEALASDLGKSNFEAWMTEIGFLAADIEHQIKHVAGWAKPRRSRVPLAHQPGRAWIQPEPLGVVLVIAPWNYPLQLTLLPIAAAIAAGNAVVAKPSEIAPATSAAIARLVPEYLDANAIQIVEGGIPETTSLLAERFDHILYTGNGKVARVVARAAAEHLTPMTLELGGKSPVVVAKDANIAVAARRIAMGKFLNAGQTCVAPDYILVERGVQQELVDALSATITKFYGDARTSADYGRIVNGAHFNRIAALMSSEGAGTIVIGGDVDSEARYIAPTLLVDSDPRSAIMQEEIFGPLLPIISVDNVAEAVRFINDRDKPLALYVFTEDSTTAEHVLATTSAGGSCINSTVMHIAMPELPFGGVGESGMGAYHGQAGFDTFSHLRGVYSKPTKVDPTLAYPPYGSTKQRIIRRFM